MRNEVHKTSLSDAYASHMSPRLSVAALLALAGFVAGAVFLWPHGRAAACVRPGRLSGEAVSRLAGYAGRIEHGVQHSGDGMREEWWIDSATGNSRQLVLDKRGGAVSEFATAYTGPIERMAWIFYNEGTWQTSAQRVHVHRNRNPALSVAQANVDRVAEHRATIVGRAATIHLREIRHLAMPKGKLSAAMRKQIARTRTVHIDTWVDPVTYLTVRELFRDVTGSSAIAEHWLPRTRANVARTKLVVPDGFRRVPPTALKGTDYAINSEC